MTKIRRLKMTKGRAGGLGLFLDATIASANVGRTLLSVAVEVDSLSRGRWWLDFRCQLGVPTAQPALAIAIWIR